MNNRANPVQDAFAKLQSGANFEQILSQYTPNDPRINKFRQIMNGKSNQQLATVVQNMCREAGITPRALARFYGINM